MLTFSQLAGEQSSMGMALLACALIGLATASFVYVCAAAVGTGGDILGGGALGAARKRALRERSRQSSTLFAIGLSLVEAINPIVKSIDMGWLKESLVPRYAKAGWPGGLDDDELVGLTIVISLVLTVLLFAVIALTIGGVWIFASLLGLALGPVLVGNDLTARIEARAKNINRSMPFILDLLVLTMRSGASLPIALERVASDYQNQPVGEEFQTTLREIEMGTPRREAFIAMADRVALPVMRTFVDDVVQAEELGRPLADTLARVSERLRARRLQDAQDTAGKAKVKVLMPGMLVFLAVLILLFAPFVLQYYYGDGGL